MNPSAQAPQLSAISAPSAGSEKLEIALYAMELLGPYGQLSIGALFAIESSGAQRDICRARYMSRRSAAPVAPARCSAAAQDKAARQRTPDQLPVQSFRDLLRHLATIVKNRIEPRLSRFRPSI